LIEQKKNPVVLLISKLIITFKTSVNMKTNILLWAFALYTGLALGATVTITNSGFAFSPDDVTINQGDVVDFQLAGIHNAIEVSESTWLENMNTPLPGFSVPLGGGLVPDLAPGIHYYVCGPHASGGMKGKITVNAVSGIGDNEAGKQLFSLYPNPTSGKFILQFLEQGSKPGPFTGSESPLSLEISDMVGNKVFNLQDIRITEPAQIDITSLPDGIYFVRINENKKIYTTKLVKH
jgi:plastocyanin